jgi:hypothetical protein
MKVIGQLKANLNSGEGDAKIIAEFDDLTPLMKMDLLKDWIYDLEKAYEEARSEFSFEGKLGKSNGKS